MATELLASLRRWRTPSGIVVVEVGRHEDLDRNGRPAVKIRAHREKGGYFGCIWLKNCTRVEP